MAHLHAIRRRHDARGVNPSNPTLIAISRAPGRNGTEPAMHGEKTAREMRYRLRLC
jgi:hypothetical protein